jgi:hypothetical protein
MQFTGSGVLFNKATKEQLAIDIGYNLEATPPAAGRLGHIDARIDNVPHAVAVRIMRDNPTLTLALEGAGYVDLLMKRYSPGTGGVEVIANGPIRAEL